MNKKIALPLLAALLTACGGAASVAPPLSTPAGIASATSTLACHSRDGLPDPVCTPGAVDVSVTKDKLCAPGFTTRNVRPPASYTDALKRQQLTRYDYSDKNPADYEEDHRTPLELGGHPTDPRNLWPEPRYGRFSAASKDRVENAAKAAVCNNKISLSDAQLGFNINWIDLGKRLGVVV